MLPLVLGLDAAFFARDADPLLVLDPLLSLDSAFLALDADPVLGLDPVPAFLSLNTLPSL
jgi:hypothetical protein